MDNNKDMEKNTTEKLARKIVIKTQQGEVEVNGIHHDQSGICPHCHAAIPLNAVVFKKVLADDATSCSTMKSTRWNT